MSEDKTLKEEIEERLQRITELPDEFIVSHIHCECEVEIEGYQIMNPTGYSNLQKALLLDGSVSLPNTPRHWDSDFPISDLVDAFQIISTSKEDVEAFRRLFGADSIGITDLGHYLLQRFDEEMLTVEVAEQFLEDQYSVNLSEFTSIEEEAADVLSNYESYIVLDGLTELSDKAAENLSKHKGALYLNELTELSDAAARSLSEFKGELLLMGLADLSDAVAESLSKHEGYLCLDGLTNLSDAATESLSKHEGALSLDGLTELSDVTAERLSKIKGDRLSLNGLTELSDAAAESLSKFKGEDLMLDSLTKLSDTSGHVALAEKLSKIKGDINFNDLTELSDTAAESLSRYEGDFLWLDGLTELSDAAAESLSKIKGELSLDGLIRLSDTAGHIALAEKLSKTYGPELNLNGLTELSDPAAKYLSQIQSGIWISFEGLTKISDEAAKSLAAIDSDKITLPAEIEQIVEGYRGDEQSDHDDWDEGEE
jgi:uncharacterized protein YxjI